MEREEKPSSDMESDQPPSDSSKQISADPFKNDEMDSDEYSTKTIYGPSTSQTPDPQFERIKKMYENHVNAVCKRNGNEIEVDDYPDGSDDESRAIRRKHPRNRCTPTQLKKALQQSVKYSPHYRSWKERKFGPQTYFNIRPENHHGDFVVYPPPEPNEERWVPGEKYANIFMNIPQISIDWDELGFNTKKSGTKKKGFKSSKSGEKSDSNNLTTYSKCDSRMTKNKSKPSKSNSNDLKKGQKEHPNNEDLRITEQKTKPSKSGKASNNLKKGQKDHSNSSDAGIGKKKSKLSRPGEALNSSNLNKEQKKHINNDFGIKKNQSKLPKPRKAKDFNNLRKGRRNNPIPMISFVSRLRNRTKDVEILKKFKDHNIRQPIIVLEKLPANYSLVKENGFNGEILKN